MRCIFFLNEVIFIFGQPFFVEDGWQAEADKWPVSLIT